MSSVNDIRQRLVESGAMPADLAEKQLAAWADDAVDDQDADALLDWLVSSGHLGEFQADAIASGHTGPLMLGGYRVLDALTQGNVGNLFHAVQDEFDQRVSLKVFPRGLMGSPNQLEQVQRELRVAVQVDHPNVVRTFQVGRIADTYFMAMEDLQGETLETRISRDGRVPFAVACKVMRDVAQGLAHLHEHDIIHRDLRPEHIWITTSGSAKIMEFSAAKDPLAFLDQPEGGETTYWPTGDEIVGTFGYMAPEQALDPEMADARSDIYSLACVLYEALSGQPPFVNRNPTRLMMRHALEVPAPVNELNDEVPQAVAETVASMLAKDPDERFRTAKDVIWSLEQFFEKEPAQPSGVVKLVEYNPEYLEWCRARSAATQKQVNLDHAVGMTPELVSFLDLMTRKKRKKS